MTTDRKIFPPNFSIIYRLQTIEGYDPLYVRRYGELIASWERGKADISPFSFNRILRPQNFKSRIADLLNVKYILALEDKNSAKLNLIFKEGKVRIYENSQAFPRAFLVESVKKINNKKEAINALFNKDIDLKKVAIVEEEISLPKEDLNLEEEEVKIVEYSENKVVLRAKTLTTRLLVLTDNFYPAWKVRVDGKNGKIYKVNYSFRGVLTPAGEHEIEFYVSLL